MFNLDQLIKELKEDLTQLYGVKLKYLLLFGSFARGQAKIGLSDIDFLMVLDDFDTHWQEIKRTGEIISTLSLKFGITISVIPIRENDYLQKKSSLMLNIQKEGKLL